LKKTIEAEMESNTQMLIGELKGKGAVLGEYKKEIWKREWKNSY